MIPYHHKDWYRLHLYGCWIRKIKGCKNVIKTLRENTEGKLKTNILEKINQNLSKELSG